MLEHDVLYVKKVQVFNQNVNVKMSRDVNLDRVGVEPDVDTQAHNSEDTRIDFGYTKRE